MSKYHLLKIRNIITETTDTCSIVFDLPDNLKSEFSFVQGQYLSLKKLINGQEIIRAYSLSSAPNESELKVSVKRIEGGVFSSFATNELAIGDELEVFPPRGSFYTSLDCTQSKNYTAFVAGSGITPVISIIKETLHTEKESSFTLFYGNKYTSSIIFRMELDKLSEQYGERFTVHHILSKDAYVSELLRGRLSAKKCEAMNDELFDFTKLDEAFLCGPQDMVADITSFLEGKGVNSSNIHFELFYAAPTKVDKLEAVNTDFEYADITLVIDGDDFNFKVKSGGFVLDQAIEEDLDVPFSCKSGVCCTCKAKVMEGKVKMVNNYALEKDEVEDGYVLTCQSIPLTSKVVLDMDE